MDPFSIIYYALICGLLSRFIPGGIPGSARFGIGAVVGIVAAILLPSLRGMIN